MRRPAIKATAETARPARSRVKGDLVPPDYMLRLMEHIGPTATAKAIGTTPGTLHKARNANTVSRPIEVASRGIWHEQGYADMASAATAEPEPRTPHLGEAVQAPISETTVLMLIQVPKGYEAILKKTAEAVGGTVTVQA